jgi:ESS family glutamate:Na+ symporter
VDFNQRQSLIAANLVLYLGRWFNRRSAALRQWNIPEPATDGFMAALAFGAAYLAFHVKVNFELAGRDVLLVAFFTTIGLDASIRRVARGGVMLAMLTAFAFADSLIPGTAWASPSRICQAPCQ